MREQGNCRTVRVPSHPAAGQDKCRTARYWTVHSQEQDGCWTFPQGSKPQPNTRHFFAPPDGTNQAKIPDGVSPARKIPVKPVYPPIARFLPPYPAKTSLHEKIFAGHRHFSKANRRFLSAVLEKILSGITGNFKQQRDMDDNDGNKKKEATMRCLRLRPRLPIPVFYFNPILSLITYTAPSRFASLVCLAGTIRGLTL